MIMSKQPETKPKETKQSSAETEEENLDPNVIFYLKYIVTYNIIVNTYLKSTVLM